MCVTQRLRENPKAGGLLWDNGDAMHGAGKEEDDGKGGPLQEESSSPPVVISHAHTGTHSSSFFKPALFLNNRWESGSEVRRGGAFGPLRVNMYSIQWLRTHLICYVHPKTHTCTHTGKQPCLPVCQSEKKGVELS